jgi:hypothetical protein
MHKKRNTSWFKGVPLAVMLILTGCGGDTKTVDTGDQAVEDTIAPVLTVLGNDPATTAHGAFYTDAGATATDDIDGTINVVTSGVVDTITLGVYQLTYTATDNAGNVATASRGVNVIDMTAPIITVLGENPESIIVGNTYIDAGATATDNVDNSVTVVTSGSVDTAVAGNQLVTYSATDSAGNVATATRDVLVVNTMTINEPSADVVYQSQNLIPINIAFNAAIATLEMTNEAAQVVYRTVDEASPLSSSLKTTQLLHGINSLQIKAVFVDGTSLQQTVDVNLQKEPNVVATVTKTVLYRQGLSNRSVVGSELWLNYSESVKFIVENEYSDGFVKSCAIDIVGVIGNDAVLSFENSQLTGVAAGSSQMTLSCGSQSHIVAVTVAQNELKALAVEPEYVLLLGVGTSTNIDIIEHYSSGQTQASQSAIATVENVNLVSVAGQTLTALRPGRTTVTVTVGDITDSIDIEVVKNIGGAQGLVSIQEGAVLEATTTFEGVTTAGKLVFRPHTVSLDEEFSFALVNPSTLPSLADSDESVIAAFTVSPNRQFARDGIVRITPAVTIAEDTLLSLSRFDSQTNTFNRVGTASLNSDYIEGYISRGGTYVLHIAQLAGIAAKQNVLVSNADCAIQPQVEWVNGSDFSGCDLNISSRLLQKYRPILKVQNNATQVNVSRGGELPVRISDLLRQGQLWYLDGIDEQVDYKTTLGNDFELANLDEADAKMLLTNNNFNEDGSIELRIENEEGVSDWRRYRGIPTVYGRVAHTQYNGERFTALQYWMYYAGSTLPSEKEFITLSTLWHEGDVEFFQVLLDDNKQPVGVSSGQHYYGESKHWREIEKQGDNPVVYVATGSHATHFTDLDVLTTTGNLGFLAREGNDGNSGLLIGTDVFADTAITIKPAIIQEKSSSVFFRWKGRFGAFKIRTGGDGPPAPLYRGPSSSNNLSMFLSPAHFHFSYLSPGSQYGSMMEAAARSRRNGIRLKKVLQGANVCTSFDASIDGVNPLPADLYEVMHNLGKMNYEYQQLAVACPSVVETADNTFDIGGYFNANYVGDGLACDYHDENISEAYRRYVVWGLPSKYGVTDGMSLVDLLSEADPACAQLFLDTDKDGLINDTDPDDDNDGLSDEGELICGTDPLKKDTDGDGTDDQEECQGGSDPTQANGFAFITSDINMFANSATLPDNDQLIINLLKAATGQRSSLKSVKFYDGHGGNVNEPATIAKAQSYIEGLGYSFTYSNESVIDTNGLSALFVLYPGRSSPDNLSTSEIQMLKDFVADGGVLVAVAENGGYHTDKTSYNHMLQGLGIEVINNTDDIQQTILTTRIAATSVTDGVEQLTVNRPSTFSVDNSATGNEIIIRLEGGEIIMVKSIIDTGSVAKLSVLKTLGEQTKRKAVVMPYDSKATSY